MTAESQEPARRSRASDADREAVVEQLREAAADGRIDLTELDARLDRALVAKFHADLVPLTDDLLPAVAPDPGPPLVLKGGFHGASRTGNWKVPARIVAYGGMGSVKIDFTETDCRLREVEVEVHGDMAGVKVVIPEGWAADTEEVDPDVGGIKDKTTPERISGTPLIRLTGSAGMAGVVVRHPNIRERRKLRRNQLGQ